MSEYEYNKGKLIPAGEMDEDRCQRIINQPLEWYDTYLEWMLESGEDFGFIKLNGEWYQVEFEVRRGDMVEEFCDIKRQDNGVINFSSQHYNGGAHWTEVLENELDK